MGYAFISYSTKNQASADAMRDLLKSKGIETWMAPGDIPVGSKYAQVISKAVKDCACFILLLTNAAQNSVWVAKETERAVNYRKPILPLQLEEITLNDDFEMYISTDQLVAIPKIDHLSEEVQKFISGVLLYVSCKKEDSEKRLKYILVDKSNSELRYELHGGSNIVGKDSRKCNICFNNSFISRIHAVINVSEQGVTITDLNTANGTSVNGKRIESNISITLHHNDEIVLGEAHLVFCKTTEDFFVEVQNTVSVPYTQPISPDAVVENNNSKSKIGSLIDDKYKIIAELGRGCFGTVYLAENPKTGKKWAVKYIDKTKQSISKISERIAVETKFLNRLDHPGLPSIIDIIDTSENFIIVMDYIQGIPLSQVINESGPQDENLILDWFAQLCDCLGYLHSRIPAILHNDIHPRNIMLCPSGRLTMIDFGSATEFTTESTDAVMLGTTYYAEPEKFGGFIDNRTDIYSLGMTMYSLLTGRDPSMPPYAIVPIRKANPNISYGLEYIIEKCSERSPDERYQSTKDIIRDLRNINKLSSKLKRKYRFHLFGIKRNDN